MTLDDIAVHSAAICLKNIYMKTDFTIPFECLAVVVASNELFIMKDKYECRNDLMADMFFIKAH